MTAQNASDREVKAFERAVLAECLKCVLGTCRSETAAWRFERRDADLIESYQENERENENLSYHALLIFSIAWPMASYICP